MASAEEKRTTVSGRHAPRETAYVYLRGPFLNPTAWRFSHSRSEASVGAGGSGGAATGTCLGTLTLPPEPPREALSAVDALWLRTVFSPRRQRSCRSRRPRLYSHPKRSVIRVIRG